MQGQPCAAAQLRAGTRASSYEFEKTDHDQTLQDR